MNALRGRLTARYAGRRVTPHLFRDIFAVKYLEDRPEDYLTLSKVLWHSNVQTTLGVYGAKFDESHGARRVDEWLDQRMLGQQAS
jgi:integrase